MRKITTTVNLLLLMIMLIPNFVNAQKMKVLKGNFDFLKGQNELNIELDFDGMTFYNDNLSESEYVSKRIQDITADKGKNEADNWNSDWNNSKSHTFPDKFIASMNKILDMKTGKYSNANYTLIVKTTWIYPGWFAAVMNQNAKVSTVLTFVETAQPSKIMLQISSDKAPGNIGFVGVPNNNDRMAEGYAKTGKSLAQMIKKKVK